MFTWTYAQAVSKAVRAARVFSLSIGIYHAGQLSGMIEYASDPRKADKELMLNVLKSAGAKNYLKRHTPEYQRVNKVAPRIIEAARKYSNQKLSEILKEESDIKKQLQATNGDEAIVSLHKRLRDLKDEHEKWTFSTARLKGDWYLYTVY